jgi:flagellar biosynthesis protein FlhA
MPNVQKLQAAAGAVARHQGLILPVGVAVMVLVILVPLPAGLMNVLLLGNIALALVILLMTVFVAGPLEFSVFPSLLLGATMLRLVLNLAATRLILTCGADGRTVAQAQGAAGSVVWSFGQFVASGSLAVGAVLFAILVIVQLAVVTKGAARISEVAARFVLDAMPGKQMAIDADLAASMITPEQAHDRRQTVAREADFYGAMDGASKFLRGDAVAAILILLVNVLGGLYVGLVQYRWNLAATAELFVRLTLGLGLVTQVPALLVAIATALIVSRSNVEADLSRQVISQLTARPVTLAIAAGLLAALALTSLPKLPLLLLGGGCLGLALILHRRRQASSAAQDVAEPAPPIAPPVQNIRDLLAVDAMRIELGFALIGLLDLPQPGVPRRRADEPGGLLNRIAALRRRIAAELGLVLPPIRIRDNMEMDSRAYAIHIRGAKVASGKLYTRQVLAIASANLTDVQKEETAGALMGRPTTEPIFGGWAMWISPSQQERAEAMGCVVADSADVLMMHLAETVRRRAAELLSRQQVTELLENLKTTAASLVAEVTAKLTTAQIHKVLQNLLQERVSIRHLEAILESLCDAACQTNQVEALTEQVRSAMGRSLCQQFCDRDGKLPCVHLSPALEQELGAYVAEGPAYSAAGIPPDVGKAVSKALGDGLASLARQGRRPVVVCAPQIRPVIRKLLSGTVPEAVVLGYNEIDSVEVESLASLGI